MGAPSGQSQPACKDTPEAPSPADADLVRSGTSTARTAAVRAGYLPIPLERVLIDALRSIPVYLQTSVQTQDPFTLYCAANGRFTEGHRRRLHDGGIKFIYIPTTHHALLQSQMECELESMAADPVLATNVKSAIVYETSMELVNQVLMEQSVGRNMPRLEKVSRAVSTLVLKNPEAFSHLYTTSQHDFYTATHMVNVGTSMTSLAYARGERDPAVLSSICAAGMLHDVGKLCVPEGLLNKTGKLTADEWQVLREHPQRGYDYLVGQGVTDEIVLRVGLEHHERMDGSGYPHGRSGDQLHGVSKICALVDSFDAMTAFRPFKNQVKSISQALNLLRLETPEKYDGRSMDVWADLMKDIPDHAPVKSARSAANKATATTERPRLGRRAHERFGVDCPAELHVLHLGPTGWNQGPPLSAKTHNISRGGLGLLVNRKIAPGAYVRVFLRGKGTLANRLLEGKILRCRDYDDGWHEIGLKFCVPGAQEMAAAAMMAARHGANSAADPSAKAHAWGAAHRAPRTRRSFHAQT